MGKRSLGTTIRRPSGRPRWSARWEPRSATLDRRAADRSQYDQVGQFASGDTALLIFLERGVRLVHGAHPQRLRSLAGAVPRLCRGRPTRDLRLQRHHRLKRSGRVIGCLRDVNPGVQKTPHREHPVQAFRPVFAHLLAVIIHVSRQRRRNGAQRANPGDRRRVHHRAMPGGSADRGAASLFAVARRCAA